MVHMVSSMRIELVPDIEDACGFMEDATLLVVKIKSSLVVYFRCVCKNYLLFL